MFLPFLGSLLQDGLKLMKDEKDFMSRSENERRDLVKKHLGEEYPAVFVDYLATVKEDSFADQLRESIGYLNDGLMPKNKLMLDALMEYVARDFAVKIDLFDRSFFFEDREKQEEVLKTVFPGDSAFQRGVRDYILSSTYQEITEDAQQMLRNYKEEPTIVVQSSCEINKDMRQEVRAFFAQKHPYSFVEFQINPQIIGGLRVFIDGHVMDNSWLSKIQKISQLAYQLS